MHEHASYYLHFKLNRCLHDFSKSSSTINNVTKYLELFVSYQCQVAIIHTHTRARAHADLSGALDLRNLAYFDFLMAMLTGFEVTYRTDSFFFRVYGIPSSNFSDPRISVLENPPCHILVNYLRNIFQSPLR